MRHKISKEAAELGMDHAQRSEEQATSVEAFGKSLQQCLDEEVVEQGKLIEDLGKQAKHHAIASQEHARAAKETSSTQEYSKAVKEHIQEVRQFNQAVQAYGKVVGKDLTRRMQKCDRPSHPQQS